MTSKQFTQFHAWATKYRSLLSWVPICIVAVLSTVVISLGQREVAYRRFLQEVQEGTRNILEEARQPVVVASRRGAILHWSDGAEELTGIPRDEAHLMNVEDLVPAEILDRHRRAFKAAIQKEDFTGTRIIHCSLRHRDGRLIPVTITLRMLRLTGWEKVFYATIDHSEDVTEVHCEIDGDGLPQVRVENVLEKFESRQ